MSLKEKSIELIMSIPHLAILWEMRKHPRYVPREGVEIEIKVNDEKLHAIMIDICVGGMRCLSTDKRIEKSKLVTLSVDDHFVELPCKNIRKLEYIYGITFCNLNDQNSAELTSFITKYTELKSQKIIYDFMK